MNMRDQGTRQEIITDERLRELDASKCLCLDCEPDLLGEVRLIVRELLARRAADSGALYPEGG